MSSQEAEHHLGVDSTGKCRVYSSVGLQKALRHGVASRLRIALVKQDCYQDLWIGDSLDSAAELLLSTQMRAGPLGLLSGLGADFHIVHLEDDPAVQFFRSQVSLEESIIDEIRASRYPSRSIVGNTDIALSKLSLRRHSDYSKPASDVDWNAYHMVISINTSVSSHLRNKFPNTVWICMPGEGVLPHESLGWDYYITHNCPASPRLNGRLINIPYTFIRPTELEDIIHSLGLVSTEKTTIYLEINSCPVHIRPPTFEDSFYAQALQTHSGLPVRIHPDTMIGHLRELAAAKYLIKTGGRLTRGNSILEAISAGVVVLLRPDDCFGNIGLPIDSYFQDFDDLLGMLRKLEADPSFYQELLLKQKEFMRRAYFYALSQLSAAYNCHNESQAATPLPRWKLVTKQVLKYSLLGPVEYLYHRLRSPL
jgi:hypothetical protein